MKSIKPVGVKFKPQLPKLKMPKLKLPTIKKTGRFNKF